MSACINNRRRTVSINSPIPTDVMEGGDDDYLDATEVVFNANLVTSTTSSIKDWRPMSSVSQPGKSKNYQELPEETENKNLNEHEKSSQLQQNSPSSKQRGSIESSPSQSRRSTKTDFLFQRTLKHPSKFKTGGGPSKGAHKSFITMDQKKRITIDKIKDNIRDRTNAYGDRVCRPYSTYSVSKSCERLAISPYGGPILPGAAGRYREHYQSRNPPKLCKETLDALNSKFQKFYINLDLVAITENKKPAGVLKRPPAPKTAKKGERKQNSLHHGANERMNAVQTTLGWQKASNEGKRFGVGYHVAMELSHNLERHRKARSASVEPEVPPHYHTPQSDTSRLVHQSPEYLTQGEIAIRQSIKSNAYDADKPKREPIKFVKKRPPSPPLSKMSRDKFLPEALRRREELEHTRSFSGHSGLRLGKTTGVHEDSVSRAEPGDSENHRVSKSGSDDVPNNAGSGTNEDPPNSEDRKLIIRGQSAKHTPRSDPERNGMTTPSPSPEPFISRTCEQNSVPNGQIQPNNSSANQKVVSRSTERDKDAELRTKELAEGIQINDNNGAALDDEDKASSLQVPSCPSENTNLDDMTDDADSHRVNSIASSSMTSFKSLDITLPAVDEHEGAAPADAVDGGEDGVLPGDNEEALAPPQTD